MTDFSPATVEARIQAAVQPQLDRCDELLDHYTEGLPREVWLPLAYQFKPKTIGERLQDSVNGMLEGLSNIMIAASPAITSFNRAFGTIRRAEELEQDDLTSTA